MLRNKNKIGFFKNYFLFFSVAEIITWITFTTSFGIYKDTYFDIEEQWQNSLATEKQVQVVLNL